LGGDLFTIGIVQALNALAQVAFMVTIVDRIDCRKLVSIGLIASAIAFFWFSLAQTIIDIMPVQIILGFSWACLYVGSLKFVTEKNEEKATASGLLTSVMAISGVIGPIYATILWALWGSYIPIVLFASFMSIIAFIIFRFSSRNDLFAVTRKESVIQQ
ncbi:MAG: MFS transporter, partial [Candidatus Thorarchaeota archaeon]